MLKFIKVLIALNFGGSLATKCMSLDNEPCIARPTTIDLNLDEHNHGLCSHQLMVGLERCVGSCNSIDDPSSRIYVPNKTKGVNLNVCNIMIGIHNQQH